MLFFLFELDWTELVTSLLRTCSGFLTDLDICRIHLEENHAPVLALQQVYSVYCNFLITHFWNAEDSEGGTKKTWYISALSFVSNTAWPLIYPKISLWELTLWNIRSIAGMQNTYCWSKFKADLNPGGYCLKWPIRRGSTWKGYLFQASSIWEVWDFTCWSI